MDGYRPTKVKDQTPLLIDGGGSPSTYQKQRRNKLILFSTIGLLLIASVVLVIIFVVIAEESHDDTNYQDEFLSIPSTERIKSNSKYFTKYSHIAGSVNNYKYAQEINNQFNEMGCYNSTIVNYTDTILSEYKNSSLKQSNASNIFQIINTFNLSEKVIKKDPTSNTTDRHQAYLGYSPSGTIIGYLIYINYATPKDFHLLFNEMNYSQIINNQITNNNISFIGIAKYGGGITRGLKVRLAAKYNLSGMILYSDPIDYGDLKGPLYPNGTWLPKSGFQRGAVSGIELCFGNPSVERANNVCNMEQNEIFAPIPVIPIGFTNAYKLMSQMSGLPVSDVNQSWTGGFNFTYHIGNVSDVVNNGILVEMKTEMEIVTKTTTNVIVTFNDEIINDIKYQNESIMIGNHRDAWVFGASDPISGTTAMLEIAKAFSEIIKNGWKPKRRIYFGSWDAEEANLIGSTQFVEDEMNQNLLLNELILYLNDDTSVSGHNLRISGDPMIEHIIKNTMKQIKYPMNNGNDNKNLYEVWYETLINNNQTLNMHPLGSGSDYSAYCHEYGITSFDSGFGGLGGTYHSIYDSFEWMKICDPEFTFAKSHAQFVGLIAYTFLNEDILPFNITNLYVAMKRWINQDIESLINEYGCNVDNMFRDKLVNSIEDFGYNAKMFEERVDGIMKNNNQGRETLIRVYNEAMRTLGSMFIYEDGLPIRQLYKNVLYAANLDSGYAHQTFPYIAYAIKYSCNQFMIGEAYNVTTEIINDAGLFLNDYDL